MDRDEAFRNRFQSYFASVRELSGALDTYLSAGRSLNELSDSLGTAADAYFESSKSLGEWIREVGRDPDGAQSLVAMIGVDMLVMRQSAVLAWYVGETDEQKDDAVTPQFRDLERADILPGLQELTRSLLDQIEGPAQATVAGGAGGGPDPERNVGPQVNQILDTAADDLEGIVKMGAATMLVDIAGQAHQLWAGAASQADNIFKRGRLRWLAGRAVEAARDKLRLLLQAAGEQLPGLVKEFLDRARKALFTRALAEGLSQVIAAKRVINESADKLGNHSVTTAQVDSALVGAGRAVQDHKNWRGWIPWATGGGRLLSAVLGGPHFMLLGAFVMLGLSVWAAAAHIGSPRLTGLIRFRIRGVAGVIDDALSV